MIIKKAGLAANWLIRHGRWSRGSPPRYSQPPCDLASRLAVFSRVELVVERFEAHP